ncbi:aspartyl protease family protein [Sandarakinorhabdus sp.]|uniref:aspartyl protease family protein n=1 Tax=Sandarakinorhabdus sp. TaxID=1916663 RepID=UPI003F70D803
MPAVSGHNNGLQIIVTVFVAPPLDEQRFEMIEAPALIDTGASRSLITRDIAKRLALPPRGKHPLVSARATELVDRHAFRLGFRVDETPGPWFLDFDLIGSEFRSHASFEVIVGMDVLGAGTLQIWPDRSFRFAF